MPSNIAAIMIKFQLSDNALLSSAWGSPTTIRTISLALKHTTDSSSNSIGAVPIVDLGYLTTPQTAIMPYSSLSLRLMSITPAGSTIHSHNVISNRVLYTIAGIARGTDSPVNLHPFINDLANSHSLYDCRMVALTDGAAFSSISFAPVQRFSFQFQVGSTPSEFELKCYGSFSIIPLYRQELPFKTPLLSELGHNQYFFHDWLYNGNNQYARMNVPYEFTTPTLSEIITTLPTTIITPMYYGSFQYEPNVFITHNQLQIKFPGQFLINNYKIEIILPLSATIINQNLMCFRPIVSTTNPTTFTTQPYQMVCSKQSSQTTSSSWLCDAPLEVLTQIKTELITHVFECTFAIEFLHSFTDVSIDVNENAINQVDIIPVDTVNTFGINIWIEPFAIKGPGQPSSPLTNSYYDYEIEKDAHEIIPIFTQQYIPFPHIPYLSTPKIVSGVINNVSNRLEFIVLLSLISIATKPSELQTIAPTSIWSDTSPFSKHIIIHPNTSIVVSLTTPTISITTKSIQLIDDETNGQFTLGVNGDGFILAYQGTEPIDLTTLSQTPAVSWSFEYDDVTTIPTPFLSPQSIQFEITPATSGASHVSNNVDLRYNNINFGFINIVRSIQDESTIHSQQLSTLFSPTTPPHSRLILHPTLSSFEYQIYWNQYITPTITNQIDYDISYYYYPELTSNQYATQPILLWRSSVFSLNTTHPSLLTPQSLPIPNITSKRVFLRIRNLSSPSTSLSSTIPYTDTQTFTILGNCYEFQSKSKTNENFDTNTLWQSNCNGTNGYCGTNGQCTCIAGFTGTTCQTQTTIPPPPPVILNPCPEHCNIEHIDTTKCTPIPTPSSSLSISSFQFTQTSTTTTTTTPLELEQCPCIDNYFDVSCNEFHDVCAINESACGQYGFPQKDPNDNNKCLNECYCKPNWTGKKCNTCTLQCYNNGKQRLDCSTCYCDKGYVGHQCHCQSQIGTITLQGWNDVLIQYQKELQSSTSTTTSIFEPLLFAYTTITNNFNTMSINQLNIDQKSSSLIITPTISGNTNTTKFQYSIIFGCDGFTKNLSLDDLQLKWNTFTTQFIQDPLIRELFTFPFTTSPTELIETELIPTDTTIPDGFDFANPNTVHTIILNSLFFIFMIFIGIMF